jgi:hypothetical protein
MLIQEQKPEGRDGRFLLSVFILFFPIFLLHFFLNARNLSRRDGVETIFLVHFSDDPRIR